MGFSQEVCISTDQVELENWWLFDRINSLTDSTHLGKSPSLDLLILQAAIGSNTMTSILSRWLRYLHDFRKSIYLGPNHDIMLLVTIEDMSKVNTPHNIAICTNACHQMPPTMAFKEETPWHANASAPAPKGGAVFDVEGPNPKATEEYGKTTCHQEPHGVQDLQVSFVLIFVLFLGFQGILLQLSLLSVLLFALSQRRSKGELHAIYTLKDNEDGQGRIDILVEGRILYVVVIDSDPST